MPQEKEPRQLALLCKILWFQEKDGSIFRSSFSEVSNAAKGRHVFIAINEKGKWDILRKQKGIAHATEIRRA